MRRIYIIREEESKSTAGMCRTISFLAITWGLSFNPKRESPYDIKEEILSVSVQSYAEV